MINAGDILKGDRRSLAKAITLVESTKREHREEAHKLLQELLPHSGKSYRIGITGTPGVGKSTFIENFGELLISQGKKVAVLAVDPSSPTSGGSILGDKTRMDKLSNNENAFIRPSPTSGTLGGVSSTTRETILLCEAAGFDTILVETVGVGQSEFKVSEMVDFFMVLLLPNAGDELQGIKKGILELADTILINKADGKTKELAELAKSQYESAIHLMNHQRNWVTNVLCISALKNLNLNNVSDLLVKFKKEQKLNQQWDQRRTRQLRSWFNSSLTFEIERKIHENESYQEKYEKFKEEILKLKKVPSVAAFEITNIIFKS